MNPITAAKNEAEKQKEQDKADGVVDADFSEVKEAA